MVTHMYYGEPCKEIKLEYHYYRKAACCDNYIKRFIFRRLAKYYEKKYDKKFLTNKR